MSISINENFFKERNTIIYNAYAKKDIKISALGDIHLSENLITGKKLDKVLYQLQRQNPNYIFILGDLIDKPNVLDNSTRREELTSFFKSTSSIAPTMLILGNHDYLYKENVRYYFSYNNQYRDEEIAKILNINLLNDSIYKDKYLFVMGHIQPYDYYCNSMSKRHEGPASFYNDLKTKETLYTKLPNDLPKIALFHSGIGLEDPKNIEFMKNYDIIFSGHTHNGCVPIGMDEFFNIKVLKNRGIIGTNKKLFKNNIRGIVDLKTENGKVIPLIYNGGIIKVQECAPRFMRFVNMICPMQMDVMTITSDKDKVTKETYKYIKQKVR